MRLCCARDNYLSVNFHTQPYLLLFLVCGDSKLCLFQRFRLRMKHLHYNWQQNRIGNIDDVFQPVTT